MYNNNSIFNNYLPLHKLRNHVRDAWLTRASSDYITCTCHIAELSGKTSHYCSDYSNEICDKLKATQTSKNIPFHLILLLVFLFKRALFPEYILAQQKNTRTHRMHFFFSIFF